MLLGLFVRNVGFCGPNTTISFLLKMPTSRGSLGPLFPVSDAHKSTALLCGQVKLYDDFQNLQKVTQKRR